MATALVAQGAEGVTLGCRESIENPVHWLPKSELAAIVLVDRSLIDYRLSTHVLVALIGAVPDPIGFLATARYSGEAVFSHRRLAWANQPHSVAHLATS